MSIDIVSLSRRLQRRYVDYLLSSHLLGEHEGTLRRAFETELDRVEVVSKGPILSILPTYESGPSLNDLIGSSGIPAAHPELGRLGSGAFELDRPLYTHQVESLRLAQEGRSVVVATGTGSGKTECFLLPILDEVVRRPAPGVRAIVVYPMNALANDQLGRLRELLRGLPAVTFGRYTGETPQTRADAEPTDLREAIANERVSREEIQQEPPHILLTNFAMLEYLLIRPQDAGIFRHGSLEFVVLDESHTYTGAQGIDVSFLMRRVSRELSEKNLRFFLTSATLTGATGDDGRSAAAAFARTLTGADIQAESVLFGQKVMPFRGVSVDLPKGRLLEAFGRADSRDLWRRALASSGETETLADQHELPLLAPGPGPLPTRLEAGLQRWAVVRAAYHALSETPLTIDELSKTLFGESGPSEVRATEVLVDLGLAARRSLESYPLLPVRVHFFFRGLNGATVCLNDTTHGAQPGSGFGRLFLENRNSCTADCGRRVLQLRSCAQCGLAAFMAQETNGRWTQPPPPGVTLFAGARVWALTLPGAVPEDDEDDLGGEERVLCLDCGRIGDKQELEQACPGHATQGVRAYKTDEGNLGKCPRCGTGAGRFESVLRPFQTGDEAPTAVLAEELLRGLPPAAEGHTLPADGRRLIAFSDSRQRAAFFAPYLARTSVSTEYDPGLLAALAQSLSVSVGEPVACESVVKRFADSLRHRPVVFLPAEGEDEVTDFLVRTPGDLSNVEWGKIRRYARIRLWEQVCKGPRQRRTWAGVGLLVPTVELGADVIHAFARRSGLPSEHLDVLLQVLLRHATANRTIAFEERADGGLRANDLGPGDRDATLHFNMSGRIDGRRRHRWSPFGLEARSVNRSYCAKVVAGFLGVPVTDEAVRRILEASWDVLRDHGILRSYGDAGGEYQLPESRVVLAAPSEWWLCVRCGHLGKWSPCGRCALPGCDGATTRLGLEEMERREERNHYRQRLLANEPFGLVVKEHTAQLENTAGREYQRGFIAGRINVLSTSTTFEMGVDVGALEAVLLRNVPPTAANYVQRAGRAGRRRDGTAVAVTFCRPLPHDQVHFHEPRRAVAGTVPLPRVSLANRRLLQRHVNSFVLGRFLGSLEAGVAWRSVDAFFGRESDADSLARRLDAFVRARQGELLEALEDVIVPEAGLQPDQALTASSESLIGATESVWTNLRATLDDFDRQVDDLMKELTGGGNARTLGGAIESVRALKDAALKADVIGFLADAHWLPSYAFPQDTVKLLVRQGQYGRRMRLERDRELGISEYAPGAEIIADGRLFRSRAVMKRGGPFRVRHYRYCKTCRQLRIADTSIQAFCGCGGGTSREFIEPQGFQTRASEGVVAPNLSRKRPTPNTDVFLVGGAPPEAFVESPLVPGLTLAHVRDGRLFRANEGPRTGRYRLCLQCGSMPEGLGVHEAPWGSRCNGSRQALDLAHVFETDTLQVRFTAPRWSLPGVDNSVFWLSFSTALRNAAAELLNIPTSDLGITYRSESEISLRGEIVLYDRVPGGAGYVQSVSENPGAILRSVVEMMRRCPNPECDPDGSCYVCLRTYSNQFRWNDLSRRAVADEIGPIVDGIGIGLPK